MKNFPFDIYHMAPADRALWRGTAATVEEAQARVREFANDSPGKYVILCLQSGTGLVLDTDEAEHPINAHYPDAETEERGAN